MALTTFNGFARIARVVPTALAPVVVLILKLNPPNLINLLIDKLFMTPSAKLRALEQTVLQTFDVVFWIGTNEKIPQKTGRFSLMQFKHITPRFGDHIVGVTLDIDLLYPVTDDARNTFLVTNGIGQIISEKILRSGEERDWIVATAAIAG